MVTEESFKYCDLGYFIINPFFLITFYKYHHIFIFLRNLLGRKGRYNHIKKRYREVK